MPFCVGCGFELEQDWNACPKCGKIVPKEVMDTNYNSYDEEYYTAGKNSNEIQKIKDQKMLRVSAKNPKSPGIAVLLTLLFPGAGHLYVERISTGLQYIIMSIIFSLILWHTTTNPENYSVDTTCCSGLLLLFYAWLIIDVLDTDYYDE